MDNNKPKSVMRMAVEKAMEDCTYNPQPPLISIISEGKLLFMEPIKKKYNGKIRIDEVKYASGRVEYQVLESISTRFEENYGGGRLEKKWCFGSLQEAETYAEDIWYPYASETEISRKTILE